MQIQKQILLIKIKEIARFCPSLSRGKVGKHLWETNEFKKNSPTDESRREILDSDLLVAYLVASRMAVE